MDKTRNDQKHHHDKCENARSNARAQPRRALIDDRADRGQSSQRRSHRSNTASELANAKNLKSEHTVEEFG